MTDLRGFAGQQRFIADRAAALQHAVNRNRLTRAYPKTIFRLNG